MLPLVAGLVGCGGLCQGPDCESSFAGGRLSQLPFVEGATETPTDDLVRRLGDQEAGSEWSVAVIEGVVALGQPAAARVRLLTAELDLIRDIESPSAEFGAAVYLRRDGASVDLWVGAPGHDRGRGAVFAFRDVLEDNKVLTPSVELVGDTAFDRLGTTFLWCPDRTGDGAPELLLPSPTWAGDASPTLAGAVFGVPSEALGDGTASAPGALGMVWWADTLGEGAGTALACDEQHLFVGAPWWKQPDEAAGTQVRGTVYDVEGWPDTGPLPTVATRVLPGSARDEWFGSSLAIVQHEGTRYLAVGGPGHNGGQGRVTILSLDESKAPEVVATISPDPAHRTPDHLGRTLFPGAGGLALLVGSPDHRENRDEHDVGRLWGFPSDVLTRAQSTVSDATHVWGGAQAFLRVGRAVAIADADADGTDELWLATRAPTP